ncbi:hypothetical protein [Streptomyces tremellae]|uniref:Pilus assembly protein TadG-related protein n=1 Tax=Streptomyces tremellae TaxID=1124239 RepID=A0ABP7G4S6_9ACTN
MIAGVLFAALAFFVVGQAGATRNGGQSAADAAALAAAQQSRDDFKAAFLKNLADPDYLERIFDGSFAGPAGDACGAATEFANANSADVVACSPLGDGRWGFSVDVVTQNTVGKSVVPGTENTRARTHATAVVVPRCGFDAAPGASVPASPPAASSGPQGDGRQPLGQVSPGDLRCPGGDISVDPGHLDLLPDMSDLFTVRLADR